MHSLQSLQVALLSEVVSAWSATVDARKGLFDCSYDSEAVVSTTASDTQTADPLSGDAAVHDIILATDSLAAHHYWLSFLLEAWQVGFCGTTMPCFVNNVQNNSQIVFEWFNLIHVILCISTTLEETPTKSKGKKRRAVLKRLLNEWGLQVWGLGLGPNSAAAMHIFERWAQTSLHQAGGISQHPAAFGARFRMLLLALRYARHMQVTCLR